MSDAVKETWIAMAKELELDIARLIVLDEYYGMTLYSYISGTLLKIPFSELPDWHNNLPQLPDQGEASYILHVWLYRRR